MVTLWVPTNSLGLTGYAEEHILSDRSELSSLAKTYVSVDTRCRGSMSFFGGEVVGNLVATCRPTQGVGQRSLHAVAD